MTVRIKNIFILSTAILSFISFWRASAIVLCDFGSSAFYAGGIAAKAYGAGYSYLIPLIMILAGFLLMVYIESSTLFTRGGVYVVVRQSMGKTMAKFSVSALVFDYLLTAPVSAVSAGLYLAYFLSNVFGNLYIGNRTIAVIFALCIILYYWHKNIKGVRESSESNLRITIFVGIIGLFLLIFSIYTVVKRGFVFPPFELRFSDEALGWAKDINFMKPVGFIGILMALGHSVLALSGLETLAQVYREIEDPKVLNLKRAVFVIFIFSFFFTGVLTFLAGMIIPFDKVVNQYYENLLFGLVIEMDIPLLIKSFLKIGVVLAAFLMLVGAVNTAIVGANGIINRVAEDGILPQSIRKLHPKYGTTHVIITVIALLQGVIVVLSRGDVFLLGEAYAFGVLWSITFNLASLIILRFKNLNIENRWLFPLNIKYGKYYIPVGLFIVFLIVFSLSLINLFTKKYATIYGAGFSFFLYFVFTYFEKKQPDLSSELHIIDDKTVEEKVNIIVKDNITDIFKKLTKPNRILVPVRNPNNLIHLKTVLENFNDDDTDIVVLYVKVERGYEHGGNYSVMNTDESELFSQSILMAEKYGKTIHPIIVFSNEPMYIILYCAVIGNFSKIFMGVSGTSGAEAQMENVALLWGHIRPKDFNSTIEVNIVWEARRFTYTLS